jgi:hypothetical protein
MWRESSAAEILRYADLPSRSFPRSRPGMNGMALTRLNLRRQFNCSNLGEQTGFNSS